MAILVFIEQKGGLVRTVAREALGEAVRLAATLGGPVVGVCAAAADPGLAALGEAGASELLLATHASFGHYEPAGYARAVVAAVEKVKPAVVLFSASAMGRDLAPRVAARLGVGLAADCTGLAVEGGRLIASRPVYAGKAVQRVAFTGAPALVSLRPKVFAPAPAQNGGAPAVTPLAIEHDPAAARARVLEVRTGSAGKVDLTEAEIIVSGGRGLKGPENFAMIEALAAALGATVGASRAVVDAGWRPHGDQVGQTGKTVSPKLYVAVAISGAIQHLAGMSSSRCIVAINKDPDAPIFKVADFGVVGDAFEVVPALTEAVKALNARG
ncbi:MAG: electron transfer flavoprotein subunit alpha/FixB family protein [Candidatus Eisenbacteria bacterium]|uniref:Electron transfer flavoprotein subunit alpha/FixB family protein n=1 Tax=Eiseniibacteriota bacterium TaxID=2212470 RepID=A0A538UEL7_UNCEI|nr:MAG: electron transfer flavoprotein subunit alpha/FixB family protein [Candidatus Eisenbacteria bacterium]